jgi:hypothetical protein
MSAKRDNINLVVHFGCSSYFCAMVGLVFIFLKLINVISWSWLWVTAPFWVGSFVHLLFIVSLWIYTAYVCKEGAPSVNKSADIKVDRDTE